MSLFGELFFTKLIKREEFNRQIFEIVETYRSKLNFHNNLSIWNHHSNISEQNLKIFRKFLSTGITGVHSNEISYSWVKANIIGFTRELEFSNL